MEHKVSRAVINWCIEHRIGELASGDGRDVADGKRLNRKSRQKVSRWSHGRMRQVVGYKAQEAGITVVGDVDERYTSQTGPGCTARHKPRGRIYQGKCGFRAHRDVAGASNTLSRHLYGRLGHIDPPQPKYRRPYDVRRRSVAGTGQVAWSSTSNSKNPTGFSPWECQKMFYAVTITNVRPKNIREHQG